jgi:hypothetical protein
MLNGSYEIVVVFHRDFSDDLGVVEHIAGRKLDDKQIAEALRTQFIKELQQVYDHPDLQMAGSYQIVAGPSACLKDPQQDKWPI